VAIYILNQKRRELSRIETEHGMQISFEPKEDLAAGTFEMERTKSRDPGDRPRPSAVGIEAGFVSSDEPEPDYPEDVDEEETETEEEETGESEEVVEAQSFDRPEGPRENRESGRRRRRRGGRGRNRDRERGERPEQQQPVPAQPIEASGGEGVEGEAPPPPQPQNEQNGQAPAFGENGEPRRRRRRRRGRRGGRDRGAHGDIAPQGEGAENQQAAFVSEADRFGALPDEIDTTPSDAKHIPGTPSAPVWTLKDDIPDTTPQDEPPVNGDDKPKKKGWWQRTFSGE